LNTNDLGRRHNKASNGILASKCQLTDVFVDERRQITIICTDFRKIPNALLFGKRNSVLSKFYTAMGAVLLHVCAIFRPENTQ